jgi:predicted CXXCH cytochrome family protein
MNASPARPHHLIFVVVCVCILTAISFVLLAASPTPTQAQPADDAEYIGARECRSCHRDTSRTHAESLHSLTLRETAKDEDKAAILGSFDQGEELRLIQFPGEDQPRAFTAADIVYAVGSGRHFQRYLIEIDKDQYMLLPAEWNVIEQTWQPYTLAEQWPDAAYEWGSNCAGCHTTGLDVESYQWQDDGVQCEACHGPGSTHADLVDKAGRNPSAEEMAAILTSIATGTDPQTCGSCHSAGIDQGHPYPLSYRPGSTLVQETGYQLVAPNDSAHWRASGHAGQKNMQYNEWIVSGHAEALTSMLNSDYANESCLHCHSGDYYQTQTRIAQIAAGQREGEPPAPVTLETAQEGITCATCHTLHGPTSADYLLVKDAEALCLDCHQDAERVDGVHHPVFEMFSGIQIVDQVQGVPSNHLEAGATCTTCHMPPSLQTGETWYAGSHNLLPAFPGKVEAGQPDSCTICHTDLSGSYLQEFINKTQSKISNRLSTVQVTVDGRTDLPTWVTDAISFVAGDGSLGVHNYAYTTRLLDAVEVELGVKAVSVPAIIPVQAIANPQDCAECHADEHRMWQTSPHANASLSQNFQQEYAATGRPSYCMSCHASGYDPRSQQYVFEGVVCSNCHYTLGGTEHPPGPVEVAVDSQVCGRCHSGAHAPTYDEWLISAHSPVGIDCVDCHTPHDNGLTLGNVNETCGSCHQEALVDEIHMGDDMTCVDCHMSRVTNAGGVQVISTGHSMNIDPGICADCHGKTHLLSSDGRRLTEEEHAQLVALEAEVTRLRETSSQNLNSGIVGGALGALVLALIVFLTVRLGRLK